MLEMICAIPEEIGWALVGAATTVNIFLVGCILKDAYHSIKNREVDEEVAHEM